MRPVAGMLCILLVLLSLAGCLEGDVDPAGGEGGDNDPADGDGQGTSQPGKGGIVGQVLTLDFQEVKDANLRLVQASNVVAERTTSPTGNYSFVNLDPGPYHLVVTSICCMEKIRGVQVTEGDPVRVDMLLEPFPTLVPHVVEESWNGFIGCSGYLPVIGLLFNPYGLCAETDPNNEPTLDFEIRPGLKTAVVAMEWDPVATNLLEDLRIIMARGQGTGTQARYFTESGPSPIEATIGPQEAQGNEDLHFDKLTEPTEVRFTVTAGNTPGNIVYQQPFTVHYHLYYLEPAPEGASALPDA